MISEKRHERSFKRYGVHAKETPTLGQELVSVFRYIFDQPEERLKATDFVWSYQELDDDIPD